MKHFLELSLVLLAAIVTTTTARELYYTSIDSNIMSSGLGQVDKKNIGYNQAQSYKAIWPAEGLLYANLM